MSQQRQHQMAGMGGNNAGQFGDTTFTKIFVGGLAWETQRETMKRYFEQFGEILEAVVITDKNTGRSKGYGFVTFKDPDSAMRACQDPNPVIDGRRANCNLASLGAQKNRPPAPQRGMERFKPTSGSMAPNTYHSTSTYFHQPTTQNAFPYSVYGYSGYPQDIYAMNYYNAYNGQQFPSYYTTVASGSSGGYYNYYPLYAQYGQSNQTQGFGIQYPQTIQYPYLPQQYRTVGILSLPTSSSPAIATAAGPATATIAAVSGVAGTASEQNSTA